MKKVLLIAAIVFLTGLIKVHAQTPPVQPIPTYNYPMASPTAYFYELTKGGSSGKEKRDMDVVVNTRTTGSLSDFAIVYVFKIQPQKVLGPFFVYPGQHLVVPIDNEKWGVRVDCEVAADVSVWIDD